MEQLAIYLNLFISILTIVGMFVGGYLVIKKWVIATAKQVSTANGKSLGDVSEDTLVKANGIASNLSEIKREMTWIIERQQTNRDIAVEAKKIALSAKKETRDLNAKYTEHLIQQHK